MTGAISPIPSMNTEVYMSNTDEAIEQEIQAKGLTAPRVTPADIEANIASEHYFTALDGVEGATGSFNGSDSYALGLITICVLITRNGMRLVGVNEGPVSIQNFDADMGRRMARRASVKAKSRPRPGSLRHGWRKSWNGRLMLTNSPPCWGAHRSTCGSMRSRRRATIFCR